MPVALELQAKGSNGQLDIDGGFVVIRRKGASAVLLHGFKGDKRIPISSVTAVQFKNAGITVGYLQLSMIGGQESKAGVFAATSDENTVTFTKKQQASFEAIRDHIEARISERSAGSTMSGSSVSVADELKKLAELRDSGILTNEEFDAQKSHLLGS
jgi:uncharacterized protein DUF4429/putative oligomerization/nucleic acid binding protein